MFLNRILHSESSNSSPSPDTTGIQVPILGISVIGFFVSLYALVEHIKGKVNGESLSCDINDLVSCSKVFTSEYGEFLGMPLGSLGMAFFAIVFAFSILPKVTPVNQKWIYQLLLVPTGIGGVVSLGLAYLSYFQLKAVCPVCTTVHTLSLTLLIFTVVGYMKSKAKTSYAHPGTFMKLLSLSLALVVPPLLAGTIAPSIAPGLMGKSTASKGEEGKPTESAKSVPPEVLLFSKSNYTGKGEDYRKGNDNAKVVVFMYSDFQCPHCKRTSEAIEEAMSLVGEQNMLFVYRNYPLSNHCNANMGQEGHKFACELAAAARCAGQQGKFWEYKKWVFDHLEDGAQNGEKIFSSDALVAQATSLGLSGSGFKQCLDSKIELEKIKEDISFGQKLKITGTPLLVIGGKIYSGPMTASGLASAIKQELNQFN
jgi:protein-disulfide isomerase/uncharacterized membrane protein